MFLSLDVLIIAWCCEIETSLLLCICLVSKHLTEFVDNYKSVITV